MSVLAKLHADYDPPSRMRSRFYLNVTGIGTENLSASQLLIRAFEVGMKIVERDQHQMMGPVLGIVRM
jgi:hypothetical protein